MTANRLSPRALYHPCSLEELPFETTSDLDGPIRFIGQPRAVEAIRFGIEIDKAGYNIFASGPAGTGKSALVRQLLERRCADRPVPPDICYVNNFETQPKPPFLRLPPGKGKGFQADMRRLVEDVRNALIGESIVYR